MGNNMLKVVMNQKMIQLDNTIKNHFKKDKISCCSNFELKINKLCTYQELENLINNLPKLSIGTNGIIFYPKFSGINNIHIEKKNEKVNIITNNNETIEQKTYHIIYDFVNFLKARSYSYESNEKTKVLWLSRTIIADVYDISEKEHGEKEGIALVPNLKISQMCDDIIKDTPCKFNCIYSNKFKKWIPIALNMQ
jgi:hypothetical protein